MTLLRLPTELRHIIYAFVYPEPTFSGDYQQALADGTAAEGHGYNLSLARRWDLMKNCPSWQHSWQPGTPIDQLCRCAHQHATRNDEQEEGRELLRTCKTIYLECRIVLLKTQRYTLTDILALRAFGDNLRYISVARQHLRRLVVDLTQYSAWWPQLGYEVDMPDLVSCVAFWLWSISLGSSQIHHPASSARMNASYKNYTASAGSCVS